MEYENDNGNDEQKAADESAGRSVSDVLTEEEEIRIWKREGYDDLPRSLTVQAVGKYLGVSRSKAYSMVKEGTIQTRSHGSRYTVTRYELFRLMHGPTTPPAAA